MARRRWWSKTASSSGDENVAFAFHSSDEDANKDLTLEIAERARQRQANKRKRPDAAIAASEEVEAKTEGAKNKTRKLTKKRNKFDEDGAASNSLVSSVERQDFGFFQDLVDASEEDLSAKEDHIDREVKEALDNAVMRKLLRGPRYFDPGEGILQTCYNCGGEDHVTVDCVMEKRRKPCFVCGMFGHNARRCEQGRDCYICKVRGHFAKDCPDKHKIADGRSHCLRCGDIGHDMSSCRNKYSPDDLKKIQCYVCKKYGHLCCVDLNFLGLEKVSCYNCAQVGHSGVGCAKQRGETDFVASPTLCYKCGEEGHFARGCTKISKPSWLKAISSTPPTYLKKTGASSRSKSVPCDLGKTHKSKSKLDERIHVTSGKSGRRVSWTFDDPHPEIKARSKANGWASSITPKRKVQSRSPCKKLWSFFGTPSRHVSKGSYQHGYRPLRFSNSR